MNEYHLTKLGWDGWVEWIGIRRQLYFHATKHELIYKAIACLDDKFKTLNNPLYINSQFLYEINKQIDNLLNELLIKKLES